MPSQLSQSNPNSCYRRQLQIINVSNWVIKKWFVFVCVGVCGNKRISNNYIWCCDALIPQTYLISVKWFSLWVRLRYKIDHFTTGDESFQGWSNKLGCYNACAIDGGQSIHKRLNQFVDRLRQNNYSVLMSLMYQNSDVWVVSQMRRERERERERVLENLIWWIKEVNERERNNWTKSSSLIRPNIILIL